MMRCVIWMVLVLGTSAILMPEEVKAATTAPFPACQQETTLSDYVVMDRPDDRPVMGTMSVNDTSDMVIGTDEGVYLYANHHYVKTLPHMLWEPLFRGGNYIYAVVNPFNRKAAKGRRLLYRTTNGKDWQLIGDKRFSTAKLFAIDVKNDRLYYASPNYSLRAALSVRDIRTGTVSQIGDKRLRDIEAIGYFKGSLYVKCHRDKLYVSHDQGKSFTDITKHLGGGTSGGAFMLANEHYLVVSIGNYYVYVFDGKAWKEIGAASTKRGIFSISRIHTLKDHQLVMTQFSHHMVVDLRNGQEQEILLPKVYDYSAFSVVNDDVVMSAQLPKDGIARVVSGNGHEQQDKVSQLLKVRLTAHSSVCQVMASHTSSKAYPFAKGHGLLIDSGKVYMNDATRILDVETSQQMNLSPFYRLRYLKPGQVKGDWFVDVAQSSSRKIRGHIIFSQTHRSQDKGKTWQLVTDKRQMPTNAIIDDSLNLAYYFTAKTIERIDLKAGNETMRHFELTKGTPESLVIDKTSRVWMQSSQGIFVSKSTGGWWQCPLPFRLNPKIAIRGFALLQSHIAVTYRDAVYLSRNDTIAWKSIPIIDPCTKEALPVRIVGNSKEHVVLVDRIYGHLWVLNISNDEVKYIPFSKRYGTVRKAHYTNGKLMVETTGTPIQSTPGRFKHRTSPQLVQFHLKH